MLQGEQLQNGCQKCLLLRETDGCQGLGTREEDGSGHQRVPASTDKMNNGQLSDYS